MEIIVESKKYGNQTLIIDEDVYNSILDWKMTVYCNGSERGFYISINKIEGPIRMYSFLHRYIMNCPQDMVVDHKNGNPLDNRKENLRICTNLQNSWNRTCSKRKHQNCNYLGVTWAKNHNKWQACLRSSSKTGYLGRFYTAEEAAKAYDNYLVEKLNREPHNAKLGYNND